MLDKRGVIFFLRAAISLPDTYQREINIRGDTRIVRSRSIPTV